MQLLSYLSAFSALLAISLCHAATAPSSYDNCKCLTEGDVSRLVDGFRTVAAIAPGYRKVAKEILAADFTSISDSVNFVDGIPLNTTMTTSRAQLLRDEAKLPPAGVASDIFVSHTCDTITWYFEFATQPLPTRGIAILFTRAYDVDGVPTPKIYKSYREVNVGAVLYNLGQPECASNFTVPSVGDDGPAPEEAKCEKCVD